MAASTEIMDYGSQEEALKRRQMLATLMQKQAMEGGGANGEMVSGHYVNTGWANAIGNIAKAYAGMKMGEQGEGEAKALGQEKQAALLSGLEGYMNTRNGAPAQDIPYGQDQIAGMMQNDTALPEQQQQTPAVAADPRGAAVKAIASQFPQLQGLGMADLAAMNKPKEAAKYSGAHEYLRKDGTMGLMQTNDGGGAPNVLDMDGVPKKALVENHNTVNGEGKGAEAWAKDVSGVAIKSLEEGRVKATKAIDSLAQLKELKPLLGEAQTGFGAEPIIMMRKIYQKFGGAEDPTIMTSEKLKSVLAQKVLDNTKLLGTGSGFTDTDRKYLEEVVLGKRELDPETIRHAINAGMADAYNTIRFHNFDVDKARGSEETPGLPGATKANTDWFRVNAPEVSLPAGRDAGPWGSAEPAEFDYDPKTKRFRATMARKEAAAPAAAKPAPRKIRFEDM